MIKLSENKKHVDETYFFRLRRLHGKFIFSDFIKGKQRNSVLNDITPRRILGTIFVK